VAPFSARVRVKWSDSRSAVKLAASGGQSEVYRGLLETLRGRSVWDDVIVTLARRGHNIPAALLDRDLSQEHQPDPAVEAA
jgi:tryptophan 2,3-dioxygenase